MLSSLPWVGRELYEKKESELDRMLGSLEGYIKRRNKAHHSALRVFRSDEPHPQVLIWGTLEARVQGADLTQMMDKSSPRVTITHHPDVRRSLMLQKQSTGGSICSAPTPARVVPVC